MFNLKDVDFEQLQDFFLEIGEKKFRAVQVRDLVFKHNIENIQDFNMNKSLKEKLKTLAYIPFLKVENILNSKDRQTKKFLFKTYDNRYIESVYMPHGRKKTITVCVSTQIGCSIGCKFCATGKMGFYRNLQTWEIIDQVLQIQKYTKTRITNIVFMGMGEPMLNYKNSLKAIKIFNEDKGFKIGQRHITLSTVGIKGTIKNFSKENLSIKLALSLHSPFDDIRSKLVPVNKVYPIKDIINDLHYYYNKVKRRITIEYILIKGLTDRKKDALKLVEILDGLFVLVNLINYNPVYGVDFKPSLKEDILKFIRILEKNKISWHLRDTVGGDIKAACGQLAGGYIV